MPITSASVEANGWVLRVVLTGAPGSFASYALDPDETPRLVLATAHPGFVKSGGIAVPGVIARALVATKPLRLPVNPAAPTLAIIDETDLGGGAIQVRIALSEHVYATDTGLALTALAGWRTGEAAAGIAVTNGSTTVAPIPIMRWVLAPYDVTTGAFRLSLLVVSHHPQGFEPVAGVRFTATNGATVKTAWATEMATDPSLGDNLRSYTAIIDPGLAPALTAGLLRCDAEVYPWLGAMRTTDPAGTRSMTGLATAGFGHSAETPSVIGYDPASTRYGGQWIFVDPAGTTTASAAMVAPSLAAAKAVPAAQRPANINTAIQAGYLANRALPAANGQAATSRAIDGMAVVLAAGTHVGFGATAVTTGLTTAEIPPRIMGDPDDPDPRGNCILQSGADASSRITRVRFQGLKLEVGGTSLTATTTIYVFVHDAEVTGKPGSEASATAAFPAAAPAGNWNVASTRSKWWKTGVTIGSTGNGRCGLFRANEHSRPTAGLAFVRNRFVGGSEDPFVGAAVLNGFVSWPGATALGQAEDVIAAYNDFRAVRGRVWSAAIVPAATASTPNPSMRRNVFLGNVCERIGNDPQPFYSIGEAASLTISYNIIEGNSFVGERANTNYSDPTPVTLADTNTQANQAFVNRVANNYFDWFPSKHDAFDSPAALAVRSTAGVVNPTGYRPQMVAAWSHIYGVGHEANVDAGRTGGNSFLIEHYGRRSTRLLAGQPGFADDRSVLGTGTGLGDYRPAAASLLDGRVVRGNSDRDLAGGVRGPMSAAGAFIAVGAELAPAAARSSSLAGGTSVGLALGFAPAAARHGHAAIPAGLTMASLLVPAGAAMVFASASAPIGTNAAIWLLPDTSALGFGDLAAVQLIPAGTGSIGRTLAVRADVRTLLVIST